MDYQKTLLDFIGPSKSCPYRLEITLWKELDRLVQKSRIAI